MPWSSSAGGNSHKSTEKFKKRKANQTWSFQFIVEETFISEGFYLGRKLLKPGLAAVPEVTQVQPLLLSQEWAAALGEKAFFCTGCTKGHFLTTKGWSSLPHHQINDGNSWACSDGLGFHLTLFHSPAGNGDEASEHSTHKARRWINSLGRSHGHAWAFAPTLPGARGVISHRLAGCGADQHAWNRVGHADRLEIPSWFST